MPLPGPILIVSDRPDRKLAGALAAGGASSVVESGLADSAAAVRRVSPVAIVLAAPAPLPERLPEDALRDAIDALPAPFVPVLMRVKEGGTARLDAVPVDFHASGAEVVARLAALLRVRALHAAVLKHHKAMAKTGIAVAALPDSDPLDDATVLVMGRGPHYPPLAAAAAACTGVIGALSPEAAARYLNLRDVDGVIIGDGFGAATIEVFLTALSADSRFGDLPVGVVPELPAGVDRVRLCGIEPVGGTPQEIVSRLAPLVRVHAFAARLRRHQAALDSRGLIDPVTGLFSAEAFDYGLPQMIADCRRRDAAMSIARFELPAALPERVGIAAARLVTRLIRRGDFAARDADGAVTVVMADAALHQCHVAARRIASVIRSTLVDEHDGGQAVDTTVTIAALRPTDSAHSLLSRVSGLEGVAAE